MHALAQFDCDLYAKVNKHIIGVDEAGRGSYAGPLVAGAVCFPQGYCLERVNDSKKLTPEIRESLYELIVKNALAWAVSIIDAPEIDQTSINAANIKAMEEACKGVMTQLEIAEAFFLVDQAPAFRLHPQIMQSKMDGRSQSVAAGSIIAKVTHDRIMRNLALKYPEYGFESSMGYLNPSHKEAVLLHGRIPGVHRYSYRVEGISHHTPSLFD